MNRWLIAVVILGVAGLEFTFPEGDSNAGANDDQTPHQDHIVAAAKAAGVHDMIVRLSDGYQTELGPYGDFVAQVDWTVGKVLKAIDEAGVATVTLARPEVHNAFDDALIGALDAILDNLRDLGVLILIGSGKQRVGGCG